MEHLLPLPRTAADMSGGVGGASQDGLHEHCPQQETTAADTMGVAEGLEQHPRSLEPTQELQRGEGGHGHATADPMDEEARSEQPETAPPPDPQERHDREQGAGPGCTALHDASSRGGGGDDDDDEGGDGDGGSFDGGATRIVKVLEAASPSPDHPAPPALVTTTTTTAVVPPLGPVEEAHSMDTETVVPSQQRQQQEEEEEKVRPPLDVSLPFPAATAPGAEGGSAAPNLAETSGSGSGGAAESTVVGESQRLPTGTMQPSPQLDTPSSPDLQLHNLPVVPAVRSARWESEHIKRLEAEIAANLYNTDAWLGLINDANRNSSTDVPFLREAYERFLRIFPTAGRYWKQYAEYEMAAGNYANVENIFRRCLLKCPNIELWRCYLSYIRLIKEGKPDEKESVVRAFEFALEHMGMDINSTSIWRDYIQYVKGGVSATKAANSFEESQRVTTLRRLYQRVIESPMINLETLWKEYDAFENSVNKVLAKALIGEYAGKYMTARAVCHERRQHVDGLQLNMLPVPPKHTPQEAQQVRLWRRLINYEYIKMIICMMQCFSSPLTQITKRKSNPERLPDDRLRKRVAFTYNQALQCLYHFAEIWHEAAQYQLENGAPDEGYAIYGRAIEALPTNLFVHLAYAELLESNKRVAEAKDICERIVQHTQGNTLAYIHYLRFLRRTEGPDAARKVFVKAKKTPGITYHLYVATAMMEYHANRNADYARDVFNAGLKKFIGDPAYVLHYLRFLIHLNDDNNVRTVFERVIASPEMDKERTGELWNLLLEFEYAAGDLASIQKLEKRRAQFFPELEPASVPSLMQRYRYLDFWPFAPSEAYLPLSFGVASSRATDTRDERPQIVARPDITKMAHFRLEPEKFQPEPPVSRPYPDHGFRQAEDGDGASFAPFSPVGAPFSPSTMPTSPPSSMGTDGAGPSRLFSYIQLFPPADSYQGPRVHVDSLISLLRRTEIPASALLQGPSDGAKKRKAEEEQQHPGASSGSSGPTGTAPATQNAPPARDIFRQRQAAKLTRFK